MKLTLPAACLGALLILSGGCKKGNSGPSPIAGTWEIRSTQAGMIPTIYYAPDNDSLLKFTNTGYTVYSKGNIAKSGTYIVIDDTPDTTANAQFSQRIIYDGNSNAVKTLFQVTGRNLTFISGDFEIDGGIATTYEKLLP